MSHCIVCISHEQSKTIRLLVKFKQMLQKITNLFKAINFTSFSVLLITNNTKEGIALSVCHGCQRQQVSRLDLGQSDLCQYSLWVP